jgi:hypothetical protein
MPRRHSIDWEDYEYRMQDRWERDEEDYYCSCSEVWYDYHDAHPEATETPAGLRCDFCDRRQESLHQYAEYQLREEASLHAQRLLQNRWYVECDAIRGYLNRFDTTTGRAARCEIARQLCIYLMTVPVFLRAQDRFRAVVTGKAQEFVMEGTPELASVAQSLLELLCYIEMPDEEQDDAGISTAEQLTVDQ